MRAVWAPVCLLALGLSACRIPPKDPFAAAELAARDDDLLTALRGYDAVPVAHARYPEARAAAAELELRMRRCHELILQALMLRGEWRDDEALAALLRAQQQWPTQPSLDEWIAATEQRLRLFGVRGSSAPAPQQPPAVPMIELPAGSPSARPTPAAPQSVEVAAPIRTAEQPLPVAAALPAVDPLPATAPESVVVLRRPTPVPPAASQPAQPDVGPAIESAPAAAETQIVSGPEPAVPARSTGDDPVALGLVAVQIRLGNGELEGAVGDLIELARRFPTDRRVCLQLGRLLHQRALLRYGRGAVAAAVADWRRVLELDPSNEAVRALLERALRENARAADRRAGGG